MKLKRIYYSIWSDGIRKMELVNSTRKTNWKFGSNVLLSSAGYFNLLFLAALFPRKYLMDYLDYLQIDFSGSEYLTNASLGANISGIFFIINYFLIFRKDRYKSFIDDYKYYNGKLFLGYFIVSIWAPVLFMIVYVIYVKVW